MAACSIGSTAGCLPRLSTTSSSNTCSSDEEHRHSRRHRIDRSERPGRCRGAPRPAARRRPGGGRERDPVRRSGPAVRARDDRDGDRRCARRGTSGAARPRGARASRPRVDPMVCLRLPLTPTSRSCCLRLQGPRRSMPCSRRSRPGRRSRIANKEMLVMAGALVMARRTARRRRRAAGRQRAQRHPSVPARASVVRGAGASSSPHRAGRSAVSPPRRSSA